MAKSFKQAALDSMTLSILEHGRTKLSTEDIVGKTLTIDQFDIVDAETGDPDNPRMRYGVFVFKELPDNFYNGGLILTKMIDSWVEEYQSLDECQKAYAQEKDKVRIKAAMGKTEKSKNNLLKVEIL